MSSLGETSASRLCFQVRSPAPRSVWWALHRDDPSALVTQSPAWLDCVCAAGGYADASRLYETADGRRVVVPLVRRTILPSGASMLASMPSGWGYGGLVTADEVTPELVSMVLNDLARERALRVQFRPSPVDRDAWAAAVGPGVTVIPRCAHVLDLSGGFERVWRERFTKKTRQEVRRAERRGVEVETDTSGRLVPVFYALLLRSFDRWAAGQNEPRMMARLRGRLRDPQRKFELMASRLGEACHVSVAWHEGRAAAASIVLRGANAYDSRAAMDKRVAAPVKANSLLQKHTIEAACRAGCQTYQLGESGDHAGLHWYKGRFGAKPYRYAEYRIERVPLTRMDHALRGAVKRVIRFRG